MSKCSEYSGRGQYHCDKVPDCVYYNNRCYDIDELKSDETVDAFLQNVLTQYTERKKVDINELLFRTLNRLIEHPDMSIIMSDEMKTYIQHLGPEQILYFTSIIDIESERQAKLISLFTKKQEEFRLLLEMREEMLGCPVVISNNLEVMSVLEKLDTDISKARDHESILETLRLMMDYRARYF